MKTRCQAKTNPTWIVGTLILVFCVVFPSLSEAELKQMTDGEMKSIALNDFVRPFNFLIVQTGTEEDSFSMYNDDTDTTTVAVPETPILIDGERLIEDLMKQYESIKSGNGPIEGVYPVTLDPSYLIKQ